MLTTVEAISARMLEVGANMAFAVRLAADSIKEWDDLQVQLNTAKAEAAAIAEMEPPA